VTYVESGEYRAQIARVVEMARGYLRQHRADGGKPALVLDIDETSLFNYPYYKTIDFGFTQEGWTSWTRSIKAPPIEPTLELFRWAKSQDIAVFFISGRDDTLRAPTEQELAAAGYAGWNGLYLRTREFYTDPSAIPFKTNVRKATTTKGWRILANIGDQYSDLEGGYADTTHKLPNPMYWIP